MYSAQTASHVSEIERLRSLRLPDTQEVCAYLDDRLGEIAGQYESGGFRPYMVFKFEGMLAVMEGLSFIERYTADDYRRKCDSITEDSFKKLTGGGY